MPSFGINQTINERRSRIRFPLIREVRYRSLGKARDLAGRGETLNISSTGALFTTEHALNFGTKIELSLNWPIKLSGSVSLKLVSTAKVVRVEGRKVAVRFETYEFRVVGHRRVGAENGRLGGAPPEDGDARQSEPDQAQAAGFRSQNLNVHVVGSEIGELKRIDWVQTHPGPQIHLKLRLAKQTGE